MSTNDLSVEILLRAHAPQAPEHLRERVLALQPEVRSARLTLPSRRLALLVIPAAAAVAVLAAVINGAFHSGRPLPAHRNAVAGSVTTAESVTTADSAKSFSNAAGGAVRQAATPSIASARLAHTDASLELRVADPDALSQATTRATQIAASLGGYARSVNYDTSVGGQGRSMIELRLPAQNVKTALARLAGLGTIVSQELSVTDLQDRFATESAQIAQLRRRVAALSAALRSPTLEEAQRVLLQIRLAEAKRALSQRLHARNSTVKAAANATVSLVIGTKEAVAPVPQERGRLGRMLHSAAGFLALEGLVILFALIVVSPFALAAFLLWLWRRRSADRVLSRI
jgi:hypothetical protein